MRSLAIVLAAFVVGCGNHSSTVTPTAAPPGTAAAGTNVSPSVRSASRGGMMLAGPELIDANGASAGVDDDAAYVMRVIGTRRFTFEGAIEQKIAGGGTKTPFYDAGDDPGFGDIAVDGSYVFIIHGPNAIERYGKDGSGHVRFDLPHGCWSFVAA